MGTAQGWLSRVGAAVVAVLLLTACAEAQTEVRGTAPQDRVEAYEAMTVTALERVEALWGEESVVRPVEVVLPGTAEEFAELTGGAPASQQAPAVTVGTGDDAHVVVHPDSWDRLTTEGRQAVLTHEVTHLSMQGDGPVPAWLGEGLAEYTAHRTSELAPSAIAGSALDGVRAGYVPSGWPEPGAVTQGGAATHGGAGPEESGGPSWRGYALSWLACAYLAETWSEEQLRELYDVVSDGTPLDEAFPAVFDVSEAEALRGWADWLSTL